MLAFSQRLFKPHVLDLAKGYFVARLFSINLTNLTQRSRSQRTGKIDQIVLTLKPNLVWKYVMRSTNLGVPSQRTRVMKIQEMIDFDRMSVFMDTFANF